MMSKGSSSTTTTTHDDDEHQTYNSAQAVAAAATAEAEAEARSIPTSGQPPHSSSQPSVADPHLDREFTQRVLRILQHLVDEAQSRAPGNGYPPHPTQEEEPQQQNGHAYVAQQHTYVAQQHTSHASMTQQEQEQEQEQQPPLLLKNEDVEDWWDEREKYPSALGVIAPRESPEAANVLEIPGGPERVWEVASQLIADFELFLAQQRNPKYHLRRIQVLSGGLLKRLPVCPSPRKCRARSAPKEFTSLALCVPYALGEICYVVTVTTSDNSLTWRVDVALRSAPFFPIAGCACALPALWYWLYGLQTFGLSAWTWLVYLACGPLTGTLYLFPYVLVSEADRFERAKEYLPSVMNAWMKALEKATLQSRSGSAASNGSAARSGSASNGHGNSQTGSLHSSSGFGGFAGRVAEQHDPPGAAAGAPPPQEDEEGLQAQQPPPQQQPHNHPGHGFQRKLRR